MLPVLDGWGVCAKIRETSRCRSSCATAKARSTTTSTALEMGADDYVVKPFEMKELLARINAVLRRSRDPRGHAQAPHVRQAHHRPRLLRLIVGGKEDRHAAQNGASLSPAATPNRVYAISSLTRWGFDYFGDSHGNTSRGSARSKTSATSGRSRPWGVGINSK